MESSGDASAAAPESCDARAESDNGASCDATYMQLGLELSTEQTDAMVAFLGALTDKGR